MKQDLRTLRNNAAFLFFMLNFLWLFIIFLLQVVQDQLKVIHYSQIRIIRPLLIRHFRLIRGDILKALSLTPMLHQPVSSSQNIQVFL